MKYIVVLILQLCTWRIYAHSPDSILISKDPNLKVGKSFFVSGSFLFPINDLKDVGASIVGLAAMPGLSIDFNKINIGILVNVEFSLISFDEDRMQNYFRNRFTGLQEYNEVHSEKQEELTKADLSLGIYYQRSFFQNYGLRFYLLASKSRDFYELSGGTGSVYTAFHGADSSTITYELYPSYPKINTCISIEAFRTFTRKITLGFKITYCNVYCTSKISETHYNNLYEIQTEKFYTENYNFSYMQLGVNLRLPF